MGDWMLKNWIGWIFGMVQLGIASVSAVLWRREKSRNEDLLARLEDYDKRLKRAEEIDQLTLYRNIDADFEACMGRGRISTRRCGVLQKMAKKYEEIGGEDVDAVYHMMDQLRKLPHKSSSYEED